MSKQSRRERRLTSPRLRGEVGAKRRVRGIRHIFRCQNSLKQPLTPTLSPQERGEGAQ